MTKNFTKLLLIVAVSFTAIKAMADTGRYRLTLRDNPATSIVIGWDQISGSNPVVYYGKTDYGTNWSSYPNNSAPDRQVSYRGMDNNFVRLSGLDPNTAYYFVIRDSEGTSQRFWFKTAPDSSTERLSFVAGGDSRNNRTPRINANKLVAKLRPHAVLFGGDMTSSGTNSQWQQWFDDWQYTIGSDGRMIPIVATRGNHESSNSMVYNLFDTPSSDVYYAITFGGNLVRTYTLNTESSISGNQTTWLQNDLLANANTTWKMAQYHKPMRPHVSSKSEGNSQYSNWSSLFYNNKVKLVIECDAHTVKTTWPVRPFTGSGSDEGFIRDDANGTVYAGEGCWGAPLRGNNDNKNWTRNSDMFNQFKWIFVDENKIEVRTIKVDNADQVGQVNDSDIFTAPSNLDIWNPSNGSVVTITNDSSGGGDDGETTVSAQVNDGNDDAEEGESGAMYLNSSDLELVYDSYQSANNQTVGIRFEGLGIPQGATIENAYVQFTVDETNSESTNLTIKGHDVDNSPTFTSSDNNISSRATTSASVNWSPAAWNSTGQAGSDQQTPELKSIVQELVNRLGWSQASALSLIITGTGERTAEAYNGSSSSAPIIYVTYTTDDQGGGDDGLVCSTSETLNYNESFEGSFGAWTQVGGDDFDWSRNSGGTPSSNTGPSSASDGSYYLYCESSSPNYSNKQAIIESPCFNLNGESAAVLSFKYHMYGASAMGSLDLQATTDESNWNSIWSRSGNQGNSWQDANVDLAAYLDGDVKLRFVGTTGTTWQGDMAIDAISLSDSGSGDNGGGTTTTVSLSITLDNYPEETSWEIKDGSSVIASGGTYGSQTDGATVSESVELADGCYDFVIYDTYGDGICCSYGSGSYSLTAGGSTLASGGSFGSSETTNFCVGGNSLARTANTTSVEKIIDKSNFKISTYPNPVVSSLTVDLPEVEESNVSIEVYNINGTLVKKQGLTSGQSNAVSMENLKAGQYIIKVVAPGTLLKQTSIIKE